MRDFQNSKRNESICIVMPALNEQGTINRVVSEVKKFLPGSHVLIVDDGSHKPIKLDSEFPSVRIVRSEKNLGVGSALYIGIKIAVISRYETIITMDSDGQHNPGDLQALLRNKYDYDLVIGSRNMVTYPWSKTRFAAHHLLRQILKRKFKLNLNDPTSGFRLLNAHAAGMVLQEIGDEYLDDTAVLYAKLANREITIGEVECEFKVRDAGAPSHQGFRLAIRYITSILRLLLIRGKSR